VFESQIVQPPTTVVGQVESERSISVLYILNRQNYPLKFQRRLASMNVLLHVRFPWQLDVGALSRNNGIVQHCCVSLDTQQYWTTLASLAYNNVNKQHCYAHNNKTRFYGIRDSTDITSVVWRSFEYRRACVGREEHVSLYCGRWRHSIVGAGKWQVNDGLYAEVPLWCATEPIARRWVVPTCVWKLSDCKNGSECWKIATRGLVGRTL
jgi:hypothetical protein